MSFRLSVLRVVGLSVAPFLSLSTQRKVWSSFVAQILLLRSKEMIRAGTTSESIRELFLILEKYSCKTQLTFHGYQKATWLPAKGCLPSKWLLRLHAVKKSHGCVQSPWPESKILHDLKFELLSCPSYFPDLTFIDYCLFPNLKGTF